MEDNMHMNINKKLFNDGDISLAKRYLLEKGNTEMRIIITYIPHFGKGDFLNYGYMEHH